MGAVDSQSEKAERPIRVLHIEDDPSLAAMYSLGLEMQGFEVIQAGDGQAGLEAASMGVDFLVVDIGLPKLNGVELMTLLRADPRTRTIPAVFLTAFSPADYRERAAALGMDDVLLKSETSPRGLAEAILRSLKASR